MAYLVVPKKFSPTLPVFFNLHGVVGAAPAANHREDVLLVQFAFWTMAADPSPETSKEFYVAASAVQPTGNIDLATINAIKVMQIELRRSRPGVIVDGRLNPATEDNAPRDEANTIMSLNQSIHHQNLSVWPRLDKIAGCPMEIKEMVVRTVQGSRSE